MRYHRPRYEAPYHVYCLSIKYLNFTTDGCVLNMHADDVIIHTSATTSDELQLKVQQCVDYIYICVCVCVYKWYFRNKSTIDKKKPAVMVIGREMPLLSLNHDQFSINLESNKIELVNMVKHLGLLVKDAISWGDQILQLCKNMNYYLHVLRR